MYIVAEPLANPGFGIRLVERCSTNPRAPRPRNRRLITI